MLMNPIDGSVIVVTESGQFPSVSTSVVVYAPPYTAVSATITQGPPLIRTFPHGVAISPDGSKAIIVGN